MLKRIFVEKRLIVLPILIALAVNAGVYAGVIYPLASSVAGGEQRAADAAARLKAAERDQASAAATVTGKARAEKDLGSFYKEVLPADLASAGRLMYLQLAQLARECRLSYSRRMLNSEPIRESTLDMVRMTMTLEGTYEDFRQFIHRIETGAPFIVIDNVALGQGREPNGPLALTLELSTFYRRGRNGA